MIKINMEKVNIFTVLSALLFLAGIGFYLYWGLRFGVWADIGIYAITVVFVLGGLLGIIVTLYEKTEDQV